MKLTLKEKLMIVKKYFEEDIPITQLSSEYKIDRSRLKYLITIYDKYGEEPFNVMDKKIYSREEKLDAIKQVLQNGKSMRQVAIEKKIIDPHIVEDWVKLYKKKGEEGIQVSRGRKHYLLHEDRQRYLANKELKERLEYLELENEYLKKSLALISKKNKLKKKK